jgi:type I restriction enzyme S subunit
MKKGWPTKTLSEVCEVFADGDWVESKDQSSEGIRLIQTGNVGEGVFKDRAEKARYISEATFRRLRCTEIVEGDCLVSRLPDPVGRSCILPDTGERMITAVDCTILRFNPKQLLPTFFNLYSQSDDYLTTVAKECTGTTRNRISRSNLGLTPIPVPPLAEQQRIVGLLDEAFEGLATAKANAEKNLQNARALFDSHLQSVFTQRGKGWKAHSLDSLCELFVDSAHRTPKYQDEGIPALRPRDVVDGKLNLDGARRVSEAEYEIQSKRHKPRQGDIVYSRELSYGWAAVLPETPRVCLSQGMCLFHPSSKLDTSFLLYVLNGSVGREQATRVAVGAAHPHINLGDIKSYSIPVPPLDEQHKITRQLDALSEETQRLAAIYQQKHAALEALKKSLLHQAFTAAL